MEKLRWTTQDLEYLPDDGSRYEIIDGELYVSKQADWEHQVVSGNIFALLREWSRQSHAGMATFTPGIIYTDDNNVIPDVVWISYERLRIALQADRKLHSSPELMVEILSPGSANERRDREIKLKLYSRRNVKEYWVVNWQERTVEIYQRAHAVLELDRTLDKSDTLESPLLPGFLCEVSLLFEGIDWR